MTPTAGMASMRSLPIFSVQPPYRRLRPWVRLVELYPQQRESTMQSLTSHKCTKMGVKGGGSVGHKKYRASSTSTHTAGYGSMGTIIPTACPSKLDTVAAHHQTISKP